MSGSIPPNSPWRGCAANYPQPIGEDDEEHGAQFLQETIYYFNCHRIAPPLNDIVYRNSSRDADIRRHVFRWDRTHYQQVFRDGFQTRRQQCTPDDVFYNLDHYVHLGGRPLGNNNNNNNNYAFVSTSLSSGWFPSVQLLPDEQQTVVEAWRYEIYAPGGISIADTLGERYQFPLQDEVCFVAGIAPQYIRSAQLFRLITTRGSRYTRRERVNNELVLNMNFNPQSHPQRLIHILRPVTYYIDENHGIRSFLSISFYQPASGNNDTVFQRRRVRRQLGITSTITTTSASIKEWYANGAGNVETYIDAAFRSSRQNEAYIFMNNEYVLLNYAPGSTKDRINNGPLLISSGFPSLKNTPFAEYGIDCAFGSYDNDESFIFSGNLCAKINFAPGTTNDKIIDGPKMITNMFPFFKNTVFENGVDAAFESLYSSTTYEAYLFNGDQYALINYGCSRSSPPRLIAIRSISQGFGGLRNTIFESGIDAAFASHRYNEAYLFKGDCYALVNFAPASTNDYIIGGVKKNLPNWPSLRPVLPRHNRGIDLPPDSGLVVNTMLHGEL